MNFQSAGIACDETPEEITSIPKENSEKSKEVLEYERVLEECLEYKSV